MELAAAAAARASRRGRSKGRGRTGERRESDDGGDDAARFGEERPREGDAGATDWVEGATDRVEGATDRVEGATDRVEGRRTGWRRLVWTQPPSPSPSRLRRRIRRAASLEERERLGFEARGEGRARARPRSPARTWPPIAWRSPPRPRTRRRGGGTGPGPRRRRRRRRRTRGSRGWRGHHSKRHVRPAHANRARRGDVVREEDAAPEATAAARRASRSAMNLLLRPANGPLVRWVAAGKGRPVPPTGRAGGGGGAPDGALPPPPAPRLEARAGARCLYPSPRRRTTRWCTFQGPRPSPKPPRGYSRGAGPPSLILGGGAGGRTADALHARRGVRPVIRGGEKRALKLEELLLGVRTADPRELGHRATREVGARRDVVQVDESVVDADDRFSSRLAALFPGTIVTSGAAPRGQATLRALVAGHVGFTNPPSSVERRAAKHRVSNSSPGRYVREPTREPRRAVAPGGAAPVSTLPEGGKWTFECCKDANSRVYVSRPSRTQQLKNPKVRQRFADFTGMLPPIPRLSARRDWRRSLGAGGRVSGSWGAATIATATATATVIARAARRAARRVLVEQLIVEQLVGQQQQQQQLLEQQQQFVLEQHQRVILVVEQLVVVQAKAEEEA